MQVVLLFEIRAADGASDERNKGQTKHKGNAIIRRRFEGLRVIGRTKTKVLWHVS
jgi:hypothetical protein